MAYFNGKRILNARVEGLYETGYAEGEKIGYADGYTRGEQDGYAKGETDGVEKGKTAERDEFWKNYQNEGNITQGAYMFAHGGWDDDTFEPRYSLLKLTRCDNMFNTCKVTDLKAILERQNPRTLSCSKARSIMVSTTVFAKSRLLAEAGKLQPAIGFLPKMSRTTTRPPEFSA